MELDRICILSRRVSLFLDSSAKSRFARKIPCRIICSITASLGNEEICDFTADNGTHTPPNYNEN